MGWEPERTEMKQTALINDKFFFTILCSRVTVGVLIAEGVETYRVLIKLHKGNSQ